MKRSKLLRLIRYIHDQERIAQTPVTFDTITVSFPDRTVTIRGRTITLEQDAVTFPLLSTDRIVIPPNGGRVL